LTCLFNYTGRHSSKQWIWIDWWWRPRMAIVQHYTSTCLEAMK